MPQANSVTSVPSTLTSSEADLFIVKDYKDLQKSQITIYASVTLGVVTSATFFYYLSPDNGTTWYPISLYNTSTGEITQRSVVVDSGTYSTGGASRFADNVPLGASMAFKVTGIAASGTPTYSLKVLLRDN